MQTDLNSQSARVLDGMTPRGALGSFFRILMRPVPALGPLVLVGALMVAPADATEIRSIDGSGNNLANPDWGSTGVELLRLTTPAYADGVGEPRGGGALPSPRAISNAIASQSASLPNPAGATDWLWQWGQFLDHDLDLTPLANPEEPLNIPVPMGDPDFDPFALGNLEMSFVRSAANGGTTTAREQLNGITAFVDASNLYGSDAARAIALRDVGNDGKMKMAAGSGGEMNLVFNTFGLPNEGDLGADGYLSGDVRANEQIGLTAVHTLFSREHNRIADDLKSRLDGGEQTLVEKRDQSIAQAGNGIGDEDDFIYQSARKLVAAQMQKITYEEFLPVLLGNGALMPYQGYDDTINPGISNEFATAAYRVGHTMLSPELLRVDDFDTIIAAINLQDAFFSPELVDQDGVDTLLKGLASQHAQNIDPFLIDDVRNFLFGPPGAGGLDLASLNIQRGRDHGLAGYSAVRAGLGLSPVNSFLEMTGGDNALAQAFASVYDSVADVDLWIGGLAEAHAGSGLVGETIGAILIDQFTRTRDGDRFYYELERDHLLTLDPDFQSSSRLSDIIRRNTSINNIQDNVFLLRASASVPEPGTLLLVVIAGLTLRIRRRRRTNAAA